MLLIQLLSSLSFYGISKDYVTYAVECEHLDNLSAGCYIYVRVYHDNRISFVFNNSDDRVIDETFYNNPTAKDLYEYSARY